MSEPQGIPLRDLFERHLVAMNTSLFGEAWDVASEDGRKTCAEWLEHHVLTALFLALPAEQAGTAEGVTVRFDGSVVAP